MKQTSKEPVDVSKYGKREADVYSYIGDKYVYFAIDVKDKNLFYHSWLPQGRSTAVELYISSSASNGMDTSCYSIRINPIDDGTFRLGIYAPNANKNEWTAVEENLFGRNLNARRFEVLFDRDSPLLRDRITTEAKIWDIPSK